jgi:hypothetical protein
LARHLAWSLPSASRSSHGQDLPVRIEDRKGGASGPALSALALSARADVEPVSRSTGQDKRCYRDSTPKRACQAREPS